MAVEIKKINGVYMGSQEIASTRFAGDANLVQYTRFEGDSVATVGSNGTDVAMTYGTGKFGQGAITNSTEANPSGISLPTGVIGTIGTGDFAVSFWFNPKAPYTGHYPFLFASFISASPYTGPHIIFDPLNVNGLGDAIIFRVIGSNQQAVTSPSASSCYDKFNHLVFTRASGVCYAYLNGTLIKQFSDSTNIPATQNITFLGRSDYNYQAFSNGANACIGDDLAIFSRALTSDEIYSLYKTGVKKLNGVDNHAITEFATDSLASDANVQMYQRFEGNSTDETANNNDGTDTAITYSTDNGKWGQGAGFNGSTSKIVITDAASVRPASPMTIMVWVRKNAGTGVMSILDHESANPYYGYYMYLNTSKVNFEAYTAANTAVTGDTTLSTDVWYHIAAVYNGTDMRIYVNGFLDCTPVAKTGNINYTVTQNATIGIRCTTLNSNQMDGEIDDLVLLNRALTSTEISNLYNTNIKKYNGISNV